MKLNFDLTTMEGRRNAVEQFTHAINEALSKEKSDEEAVIVMYKDDERSLGTIVGRSSEIAQLQAKCLAQYPEIIEPTLKIVPLMLIMKHLQDSDSE